MRKFLVLLTFLCVLLAGCTVKQDISIKSGRDGDVFIDLELDPVFVRYINDVSETTGTSAAEGIFNTQEIYDGLSGFDAVDPVSVITPEPSRLTMIMKVDDYSNVLPDRYVPVIRIAESGSVRTVYFHLGTDNYGAVDKVFGISSNPVLAGLAPQSENPYSESEYISMLDYVFSDYFENNATADSILKNSFVQLNIRTDGKILESDMGEISGNNLKVRIPMIKFATLKQPVEFSFKYSF
ncbi:MAG: hypothetical protein MJ215_05520 [Spirochaetia bacterium]|nr:hypothetical protein [Spirochaetia bacterium]